MAKILLSAMSALSGGATLYVDKLVSLFPNSLEHTLTVVSATPPTLLYQQANIRWIRAPGWTRNPVTRVFIGYLYFRFWRRPNQDFDAFFYAASIQDFPRVRRAKLIVAFHNMIPFDPATRRLYPFGYQRLRHWLLRLALRKIFTSCDLLLFSSKYAQAVIDEVIPTRRGRSTMIYNAAIETHDQLHPSLAAMLPPLFVLYLSPILRYKRHLELIQAWALAKETQPTIARLVFAGSYSADPSYTRRVRRAVGRLNLSKDVIFLGHVPHSQTSELMRRSLFNVYASSCENGAMTLLELLRAGSPLISSISEPMPEIGGACLDYFDPQDIGGLANLITAYLADNNRRHLSALVARKRSERYDWEATAEQTWAAIFATCGSGQLSTVE